MHEVGRDGLRDRIRRLPEGLELDDSAADDREFLLGYETAIRAVLDELDLASVPVPEGDLAPYVADLLRIHARTNEVLRRVKAGDSASAIEMLEAELERWRERALEAERRLRLAQDRLLGLFDPVEDGETDG